MGQYDLLADEFGKTDAVFTAFDTETTGLEAAKNKVVEIGGIRFDSRGIRARFNVLVNPLMPMPGEVTKINGITDAMLAGQPDASVAFPDFLRFAGDTILIAHNAPFDVDFVNAELGRLSLPGLRNRVVDTRLLAKELFPGLPKYSLQELAVRFGIEAKDAHRAEDDARVCMELFLVCVKKLCELHPATQASAVSADPAPAGEARSVQPPTEPGSDPDEGIELFENELFGDDAEMEEDFDPAE